MEALAAGPSDKPWWESALPPLSAQTFFDFRSEDKNEDWKNPGEMGDGAVQF